MEGEAEPGEIKRLKRDLREYGADAANAGEWLATAMTASWAVAAALLDIDGLADLLGERHRIIANNWQAAGLITLASHVLERAAATLDHVDFAPCGCAPISPAPACRSTACTRRPKWSTTPPTCSAPSPASSMTMSDAGESCINESPPSSPTPATGDQHDRARHRRCLRGTGSVVPFGGSHGPSALRPRSAR